MLLITSVMDLKCGAAAELPGVEHKGGGDATKVLTSFSQVRGKTQNTKTRL